MTPKSIPELYAITPREFMQGVYRAQTPVVLRGLVADWPAVLAAQNSDQSVQDHLAAFGRGEALDILQGPASRTGLYFYNDDLSGVNFTRQRSTLIEAFRAMSDPAHTTYIQSIPTPDILAGFAGENPSPLLSPKIIPRIWIGNRLAVQTHFDLSQNVACVVAGRRRFTLFPPSQTPNLYMGPIDNTIAGTPVSMVRLDDVDHVRYPRFQSALNHAWVAELGPGDAIFIPYMWWHHVQSLSEFNILVNYWWNEYDGMGSPMDAMLHGILAFRDLPPSMRDAWKVMFETFVFEDAEISAEHIPKARRGGMGALNGFQRTQLWQALARGIVRFAQSHR